ncbi:MAG TPA: bacterial transcriptional activator domain-containing protein [Geminicoccaceae bacterium]
MFRQRIKGLLLMTSALGALAWAAGTSGAAPREADVSELFDPAIAGAGLCGGSIKHATTFKPMQVAMVSPAEALAGDPADPPLWEGLGTLSSPITTDNELAQRYFDQGLRLAYAFNHAEAYRAFKKAQELDPGCAMCFWGEAFVLGANINASMEADAVQPAFVAMTNAKARAAGASARERALIDALARRYSTAPDADPAALAGAYADAMAAAHAQYPDDQDIAVLFADALMNTSPWDYWELDGRTLKGRLGEAATALEGVLAKNPDHPGAIHMYIHLTEASATPERAEPYADRLAALMPAAGHIVHMPSHTYYRVGRYLDSLNTNIKAVEADEAYLAQVQATGAVPYGYYPHNIHFVLVSAQMAGDAEHMLWAAERLDGKIPDDVAAEVGWIQVILPAPYFAHAQFSPPEVVLGLEDPGEKFPFVKAMWHYARGVAHAAQGDLDAARAEAAHIAQINQSADFDMLLAWAVPAPDVLRLARHVLEGRIAQAEGDFDRAIREFETAVQIQDSLPYLEPEYWYYPVRQSLGAALLMAGRADEATEVFRAALIDAPNNGWALYGLMQAYEAQGDQLAKTEVEKLFTKAWAGDAPPDLARL